jgi:hypothetical protein
MRENVAFVFLNLASFFLLLSFFLFAVLGLELRAFTLIHYTCPIFVKGFMR